MVPLSCCLLLQLFGIVWCYSADDANLLLRYLFDDARYNKHVRPVRNHSTLTQVNISQQLFRVEDFDIVVGEITTTGYIQAVWYDELLVWNVSQYGGIEQLALPAGHFWKPDLILAEGSTEEDSPSIDSVLVTPATVFNNGLVMMSMYGKFTTSCLVDTTSYPLDSHACAYTIMSSYPINGVRLQTSLSEINMTLLKENGEWSVEETTSRSSVRMHKDVVENTIILRRRSRYVLVHNAIPISLLAILLPVSFWVPPNSGERLSFIVAIFLSFVFLSSSISTTLPHNSISLSPVSVSLVAVNIISTICVAWSAMVVKLSMKTTEDIPNALLKIARWNVCSRKRKVPSAEVCKEENVETDSELQDGKTGGDPETESAERKQVTWLQVAIALDRLCCYGLLVCMLILVIYFVVILVKNK